MFSYTAVKRVIKYTKYYIRIKTLCCVLMLSSIVLYLYCIHRLKIFRSLIVYTNECCCIFAKCIRFSDFFSNLDFIFIIICLSYVIYIMNDIIIIMFEFCYPLHNGYMQFCVCHHHFYQYVLHLLYN